jgi:lauroyl/myristoyl acyltransferase
VLWYRFNPGRWAATLENYAAVLEREPRDPEVARVARAALRNYGQVLADFIVIGGLSPDQVRERVTVEGLEHVDEALASGRGCIMAVPHMGSWDMAASFAGVLGYRIAAVANRMPGSLDDAVVGTRQALGLKVIPLARSAVRAVLAELQQNAVVALLCDLAHGPGVPVRMFGRQVTVPGGPASIACRAGAPLLPACVLRKGPGTYHVVVDPPMPTEGRCTGKDSHRELMQEVVGHFERFIRAHPDHWFAFQQLS